MSNEFSVLFQVGYWVCVFLALYPYVGYPAIVYLLTRLTGGRTWSRAAYRAPVSIVITAYNEERRIVARVLELARIAAAHHPQSEVIAVSDGSTDGTMSALRSIEAHNLRLIEFESNLGKSQAINAGMAAARCDIVVLADVRQSWNDQTLPLLLENFADPEVGAASGDLELCRVGQGLRSVGLYWRFEKWLRHQESRLNSSIGVTGAVCAVRRALFRPLPGGTILDDVLWPMVVVLAGFRVIHDSRAKAFDQLPADIGGEYQRKLRTLSGNYQLLSLRPALLMPWRNPAWFQFVSHKVMRLASPWFFLVGLAFSCLLWRSSLYAVVGMFQTIALGMGLLAMNTQSLKQVRPFGLIASIVALNCAAWMAFWVWALGQTAGTWKKIQYAETEA